MIIIIITIIIIDRFYIALFSALEQTHCARKWFYMSEQLFIARFCLSTEVVYLQRSHGWCHMKLLPSHIGNTRGRSAANDPEPVISWGWGR